MITDRVMMTKSPPRTMSSSSVRDMIASPAKAPPMASEPVSPMKIFAGEVLNHRKPKQAAAMAPATIARSRGSRM